MIVATIVIAALCLFATSVRRSSMFFPEKYPTGNWESATAEFHPHDLWIPTRDGLKLHGWFFAAAAKGVPTIIWFHGNAGNITERALIADELRRHGVSVLLFDWRGYGKSEGEPTESSLFIDAEAVYDFAVGDLHARAETIALYGESLGGPYAAWLSTRRRAHCVVIENSFPSLRDLGNALYAPVPLGYFAPCSLTTTRWLNRSGVPVLVMHGRRDQVIPFNLGMRLYDDLRVPKRLLVSDAAGHGEIASVEGERYYETVTSFVKSL